MNSAFDDFALLWLLQDTVRAPGGEAEGVCSIKLSMRGAFFRLSRGWDPLGDRSHILQRK